MSFDYPQQPRRRKKGGISGILMLMIVVFGLYFFMNSRGGGGSDAGEGQSQRSVEQRSTGQRSGGAKLDPYTSRELQEVDRDRRLQETVFGDSKADDSKNMPSGRAASNSDWSMEGVGGNKSSTPAAKKTTEGDWSLEQVVGGGK